MEILKDKKKPFPANETLDKWVKGMGGPEHVSNTYWGSDPATIWKWATGEYKTPLWVMKYIELAEINGVRRNKICSQRRLIINLKRKLGLDDKEIKELEEKIEQELRNELKT